MDIVERIKKLLALAERNTSTAEAASAAAKAQQLAFDHELDLAKIKAEGGSETKTPYVKFDFELPETSRADVGWKRTLFGGVCKGNFCQAVTIPKTSRLAVIGQKHNYETVAYLYEYLAREIQRLAIDNCIKQAFLASKDKRQYIAGFCEGAVREVYFKLTASTKTREEATSDSRALMVVKGKELADAIKVHFSRLTITHRRPTGSSSGYNDGRRVGANIGINRGVGHNNGRMIDN